MPVDLPRVRPEPAWVRLILLAVRLAAEAYAWTLIWRYRIADAGLWLTGKTIKAGIGLSNRRPRLGGRISRAGIAIGNAALWISPNHAVVNDILQRHRRRGDNAE